MMAVGDREFPAFSSPRERPLYRVEHYYSSRGVPQHKMMSFFSSGYAGLHPRTRRCRTLLDDPSSDHGVVRSQMHSSLAIRKDERIPKLPLCS